MFNINEEFNFGSYWTFFSSFKACKSIVHGCTKTFLCYHNIFLCLSEKGVEVSISK